MAKKHKYIRKEGKRYIYEEKKEKKQSKFSQERIESYKKIVDNPQNAFQRDLAEAIKRQDKEGVVGALSTKMTQDMAKKEADLIMSTEDFLKMKATVNNKQAKKLNEKLKDISKKEEVTKIEMAAIEEYKAGMYNSDIGGYTTIQGYLRDGKPKFGKPNNEDKKKAMDYADKISSAISKSPLEKELVLYRGVMDKSGNVEYLLNAKVGDKISDKGFTSTTTSKQVSKKFTDKLNRNDKPILITYMMPKGSNALKVADYTEGKDNEKEYLLDKNAEFEITKVSERLGVKHITMKPATMKKSESVYKDESMRHMDEACKYKDLQDKLKSKIKSRKELDKNYEAPESASEMMQDAKMRQSHHKDQYSSVSKKLKAIMKKEAEKKAKEMKKGGPGSGRKGNRMNSLKGSAADLRNSYEAWDAKCKKNPEDKHAQAMRSLFADKVRDFMKQNAKTKSMAKALMQTGDWNYTAVDTADYSIVEDASKDWLDTFRGVMRNYNYGDAPRDVFLDNGYSIMMSKVDDGLYSGFVQQTKDRDGAPLPENVAKVEKQSLPDIIQFLKAREYIMPETYEESVDRAEMEVEAESKSDFGDAGDGLANSEMGQEDVDYNSSAMMMNDKPQAMDRTIRFMELLDRVLNRV